MGKIITVQLVSRFTGHLFSNNSVSPCCVELNIFCALKKLGNSYKVLVAYKFSCKCSQNIPFHGYFGKCHSLSKI